MRWKAPTLAVFAAALLFAAVTPARAQTPEAGQPPEAAEQEPDDDFVFDFSCMDDNGRNLCDQAEWAETVKRFGLEPAEVVQGRGLRGVRAFTIDGHGNDMPVVSVLAASFDEWGYPKRDDNGQPIDAELDVRWYTFRDGKRTTPASLGRKAWFDLYLTVMDLQTLVASSPEREPERRTVSEPDANGDVMISVCSHPWVAVTESVTESGVARRIRHGCDSDVLLHASFDLSDLALRGFAHCNHLDPAHLGEASEQLRRCLQLEGPDRFAAADVANIFDASFEELAGLNAYMASDVRLVLQDHARLSGASAVVAALAGLPEHLYFHADHFIGEADRVTVAGSLDRYVDDRFESADIAFVWRRQPGEWRITDITIGPTKSKQ